MELVELHLGSIFHDFRGRVELLRDDILAGASKILLKEEQASIRRRWYRTGATLASLRETTTLEGNRKTYTIEPTATNRGAPYPLFGEYGTGRRGAASGRPAPRGYLYGSKIGMDARRYSRIALASAKPQIVAMARNFARNMTVN